MAPYEYTVFPQHAQSLTFYEQDITFTYYTYFLTNSCFQLSMVLLSL